MAYNSCLNHNSSNCEKGMFLRVYEKFEEKLRWSNIEGK